MRKRSKLCTRCRRSPRAKSQRWCLHCRAVWIAKKRKENPSYGMKKGIFTTNGLIPYLQRNQPGRSAGGANCLTVEELGKLIRPKHPDDKAEECARKRLAKIVKGLK